MRSTAKLREAHQEENKRGLKETKFGIHSIRKNPELHKGEPAARKKMHVEEEKRGGGDSPRIATHRLSSSRIAATNRRHSPLPVSVSSLHPIFFPLCRALTFSSLLCLKLI
ncbi:hypothetical protein Droror1_Dr00023948 [Drosera rotundifolia]